ncbi:MAG: DoxX family membrane protein [bacterium]|nr:DoxX family membrane protein [bacterium]
MVKRIFSNDSRKARYAWAALRIGMGWIFLWSFIDKLFGLGFSTCRDSATGVINYMCESAWINGGSPTFGFLSFATKGPFADYFKSISSSVTVEWLFMLGLLFVGITLIFGILVRLGSLSGIAMLLLMYLAGFLLPVHNPILDEHIMYSIILVGIILADAGRTCGFEGRWSRLWIVQRFPILR